MVLMISSNLFDVLGYVFEWFSASGVFDLLNIEQKYHDNLRIVTSEELARMFSSIEPETKYFVNSQTCLHRDPEFQEFLMNRPHFHVKYHRKRSDRYNYITPTITRVEIS